MPIPKKRVGQQGETKMFDTVKEIIKAGGVVIMGGATFLMVVKVIEILLKVFGVIV